MVPGTRVLGVVACSQCGCQVGVPVPSRSPPSSQVAGSGPREFARGEVDYDDQGRIAAHTVAAGDVDGVIGERPCIDNGESIRLFNGHKGYESLQRDEVLVIDPTSVPGFEYEDPDN